MVHTGQFGKDHKEYHKEYTSVRCIMHSLSLDMDVFNFGKGYGRVHLCERMSKNIG